MDRRIALLRRHVRALRELGGDNPRARRVHLDRRPEQPSARCFGDDYRAQKERDGMSGHDQLGMQPGKSTDYSSIEKWEERKARRAREASGTSQDVVEIDHQDDDGEGIDDLLGCRAPSRRPRPRPSRHHLTFNEIDREQIKRGEANEKRPPVAKPGAA